MIDAVSSSRVITTAQTEELIRKISFLTNEQVRDELKANIYLADLKKSRNAELIPSVEIISEAIREHRKITFQYWSYDRYRNKILKHDGQYYTHSPYAMVWNDDRYYMVGWSDTREKIVTFRIDRMKMPRITDEVFTPDPDFNPITYANSMVKMYSGEERDIETVKLFCPSIRMQNVLDKFGEQTRTEPADDDDHFYAYIPVDISETFFAWVFQFMDIQILEPERVRKQYLSCLKKQLEHYE